MVVVVVVVVGGVFILILLHGDASLRSSSLARIHACLANSPTLHLSSTTLLKQHLTTSLALKLTEGGIAYCARAMFAKSLAGTRSANGYRPHNIDDNMTPKHQTSAARPSYGRVFDDRTEVRISWLT